MTKRKSDKDQAENTNAPENGKHKRVSEDDDDDDDDEEMDMVNIDFEWFDPQPAVDFHGLKTLLRQLFDADNQLFDLSELTDLILSQPLLGSTVKVDGNETDPYAFLTVLNLTTHKDKKVIQDLVQYLSRRCPSLPTISSLLCSPVAQVGLILTERFINMPHQIMPPMYTMLLEEIQWALEESEPYAFTHFLLFSKCYSEVASNLHSVDPPSKKKRKDGGAEETFYFHPEDEVLHQHALGFTNFEYETPVDEGKSDSKRAFQELGVKPKGHVVLIEAEKFEGAVTAVKTFLGEQ